MKKIRAVVIGAESLIGRDLRDLLAEKAPDMQVKSHSGGHEAILVVEDDEPAVVAPLTKEELSGAGVVFLTGDAESSRNARQLAPAAPLIDLTYGLEALPDAQIRAPMAEPTGWTPAPGHIHVIAHPAAIALAMFLGKLSRKNTVTRCVATVVEPASERGRAGIDELHKQTVQLLAFHSLPQKVFDAQLAFNLLPRYGTEAPAPLESFELRLEQHLATLIARLDGVPMPSVRLVQAPVFHGHSISAWVEFSQDADPNLLADDLLDPAIEVRGGGVEPPSIVAAAGQSGITVGAIEADRNHPRAAWFWIVADNHRLVSENALLAAKALPTGKAAVS